jgi:hypothetical protein
LTQIVEADNIYYPLLRPHVGPVIAKNRYMLEQVASSTKNSRGESQPNLAKELDNVISVKKNVKNGRTISAQFDDGCFNASKATEKY